MQKNILRLLLFSIMLFSVSLAYSAEPSTKLYVFDCGSIQVRLESLFTGRWRDAASGVQLTNTCYLIKQGATELLWETGLSDSLLGTSITPLSSILMMTSRVKKTLRSQLKEIELEPEDIEYVAVSHMHNDHVGNLELFKEAKILIQKEEYEAAFGPAPNKYHFDTTLYDDITKNNFVPIEEDNFDVFGDGRVQIVKAPGHTPGHQMLLVNLDKREKPILLSGDLFHTKLNYEESLVPVFNADKGKTLKSMNKVHELLEETGADLWIQHDLEQYNKLKLLPDFYN